MSKNEILPKMLDSDYTLLLGLSKKLRVGVKNYEFGVSKNSEMSMK